MNDLDLRIGLAFFVIATLFSYIYCCFHSYTNIKLNLHNYYSTIMSEIRGN